MESEYQEMTLADLPVQLQRYIWMMACLGPLAAILALVLGDTRITTESSVWIAFLFALTIVAERFPVHLTHKANLNVGTAVYLAMIFLLPGGLPAIITLVAAILAQLWRRSLPFEAVFNISAAVVSVATTVVAYHIALMFDLGPEIGIAGSAGAIVVASTTFHFVNTALVALAGALQLELNAFRVWWTNLGLDLMPQVILTGIGVVGAYVFSTQLLYLPFVIIPTILVHHSVKEMTKLRGDTHEALISLVDVIELRDPYTAGHSHRVAAISRILALRLGMTAEEADVIERAGRVHDLGKAAVDVSILTKPGRLNAAEWEQMRLHPVHGANVIDRFGVYHQIATIVRHHHESLNGQGYPDGLTGDVIPLGSRIIAVADTFDALTTSRPYRPAKSRSDAMAILESGAGVQWDERIVAAMSEWLQTTGGEVPSYRPTQYEIAAD